MPRLHFLKKERDDLLEAIRSERALSIFKAGLPQSAKDKVSDNGYVDGTLRRVAEYLITCVVPIEKSDTEAPSAFLSRQAQYEGGVKSAMYPPGTDPGRIQQLAQLYEYHWEVCLLARWL